jgi:hypothetical protein
LSKDDRCLLAGEEDILVANTPSDLSEGIFPKSSSRTDTECSRLTEGHVVASDAKKKSLPKGLFEVVESSSCEIASCSA